LRRSGTTTEQNGIDLDAQAALAFVAKASALIARSLDYDRTLGEVARLAVPELADWCAVDVLAPDGSLRQVTSTHPDPELEELLLELRRLYRSEKRGSEGVARVIATGEPELMRDVTDQPRLEIPAEAKDLYSRLAPRSYMIVPLIARGRTIGAVTFLSTREGRHYGEGDLRFAQDLAHRLALAVDNARLYEEASAARDRLAFLSHASEVLARSLDLDRTLDELARLAVPRLGDWCSIELVDENGEIRNAATAHVDPEKVELAARLRTRYPIDPDDATGVANVVKTGRPELFREIPDRLLSGGARDEEHLRVMRALGLSSAIVVPLSTRGRTLGALTLIHTESGRRYDEEDLRLAQEFAGRAAIAVANASRYAREHEAVVALQQTLLPQRLPEVQGVEFGVRYVPAASELAVGGDWYDCFELSDGRVGVAIGDVAGHGVDAAAAMGEFRQGLRAYALDGRGPVSALERLNALVVSFSKEQMATLAYAELDPARDLLSIVRAGHPPPLLRTPPGEVIRLLEGGGLPVGIDEETHYEAVEVPFAPGSTLFLYTDGLVEGGDGLDAGISQVEGVLADVSGGAEDLCAEVLRAGASERSRSDDIAILALRRVADRTRRG
jgi:serine phosphatase RsbU (regulator of sigma subunit)